MSPDLLAIWQGPRDKPIKSLEKFIGETRDFTFPKQGKGYNEINRFVFRGVASNNWSLIPSLLRVREFPPAPKKKKRDKNQPGRPWLDHNLMMHIECEATLQFRRKAKFYEKYLPDPSDIFAWWQLMQHHRALTRLLDWTHSPYAALYFAVCDGAEGDAAVWMVDSEVLAHRAKNEGREPRLYFDRGLGDVFGITPTTKADPTKAPSGPALPNYQTDHIWFEASKSPNSRMSAQNGWFSWTSHVDTDHGSVIAHLFHEDPLRWCRKLTIAGSAKHAILRDLWRMNITGETIYHGLDGLGLAMKELADLLKPEKTRRGTVAFKSERGNLSSTLIPPAS